MENRDSMHGIQHSAKSGKTKAHHSLAMYQRFAVMAVLMFVAMFFIMYAMVDGLHNLVWNINNMYMTLLMVSAMLLIELAVMKGMYPNKKLNGIIIAVSIIVGGFSWVGIREQLFVKDKEFVQGMIPHHAAAILMAEKTKLTDPELIQLQQNILTTQSQEIELMKRKLEDLKNK